MKTCWMSRILILVLLLAGHASILSSRSTSEPLRDRVEDGSYSEDRAHQFAIGILKQMPPEEVVYANQQPVAAYTLAPSYYAPNIFGLFSAKNRELVSPFLDKPVILKGHQRWYLTGALKKQNGEDAFKVVLPEISVFEITDIIPADIRQDNSILSVEAPTEFYGKECRFDIRLASPFTKPLENGIMNVRISAVGFRPKNLEIKDWRNDEFHVAPFRKEAAISLSSKEVKEIPLEITKKEDSIILEQSSSESPIRIFVDFIGYIEPRAGQAEVISAHSEVNYLEKYIGRFEHIPYEKIYGAILRTSFGNVMIAKRLIEERGDVSVFDGKEVKISGSIDEYIGYRSYFRLIDTIEIMDRRPEVGCVHATSVSDEARRDQVSCPDSFPKVVLEESLKLVASRTGERFCRDNIRFDRSASQVLSGLPSGMAEAIRAHPELAWMPCFRMRYRLSVPESPWVDGRIEFFVDKTGHLLPGLPVIGIPDCVHDSSECRFPINKARAFQLARKAGLAEGVRPWEASFHWKAGSATDPAFGTYVWSVSNTTYASGRSEGGQVMRIDANSGQVVPWGLMGWESWWEWSKGAGSLEVLGSRGAITVPPNNSMGPTRLHAPD
ncbi:MAG: hypothetical protein AMJ46_09915 [Latescibacteria bacterium DG_63]|nr:MAG: hypothetical protein AMJ46_09915 [Latescibacteria bacterium DG_63]